MTIPLAFIDPVDPYDGSRIPLKPLPPKPESVATDLLMSARPATDGKNTGETLKEPGAGWAPHEIENAHARGEDARHYHNGRDPKQTKAWLDSLKAAPVPGKCWWCEETTTRKLAHTFDIKAMVLRCLYECEGCSELPWIERIAKMVDRMSPAEQEVYRPQLEAMRVGRIPSGRDGVIARTETRVSDGGREAAPTVTPLRSDAA